ncbi:MAG TPA: hypothetical protein VLA95_10445 [Gemmatimonadales bacterium]|nr:hypothetical protein [Gemmatimonadales bacterium]
MKPLAIQALRGPALAALPLLVLACQTAGTYVVDHSVGYRLGACAGPMDSVRAERGEPDQRIVGDEEDTTTKVFTYEHEWGYFLGEPDAVRLDSVDVVRFRWSSEARWCDLEERRAQRLGSRLGPPWETE